MEKITDFIGLENYNMLGINLDDLRYLSNLNLRGERPLDNWNSYDLVDLYILVSDSLLTVLSHDVTCSVDTYTPICSLIHESQTRLKLLPVYALS